MKLSSLLSENQIILEMQSTEHDEAVEELVNHLEAHSLIEEKSKAEEVQALLEREEQISTGIGSSVAIPHAFSESVEDAIAIFGRSRQGIDFEALDHAPVKLIVLFIVPKTDYHKHLQTLAAIAKLFKNCEVRKQLIAAESKEVVLNIFDPSA